MPIVWWLLTSTIHVESAILRLQYKHTKQCHYSKYKTHCPLVNECIQSNYKRDFSWSKLLYSSMLNSSLAAGSPSALKGIAWVTGIASRSSELSRPVLILPSSGCVLLGCLWERVTTPARLITQPKVNIQEENGSKFLSEWSSAARISQCMHLYSW